MPARCLPRLRPSAANSSRCLRREWRPGGGWRSFGQSHPTQRVAQSGENFGISERSRGDRRDGELRLHLEQPLRHYLGLLDAAEVGQCRRAHPIRRAEPRLSLDRAVCCGGRFLKAAGYEMGDGNGHVANIAQWIERAEPQSLFGLLDCYRALAAPCPSNRTEAEGE